MYIIKIIIIDLKNVAKILNEYNKEKKFINYYENNNLVAYCEKEYTKLYKNNQLVEYRN